MLGELAFEPLLALVVLTVQLVLFSLGATYLWVTGVASLWRDDAWRAYRVLAWAWLVVLAILASIAFNMRRWATIAP